MCTTMSTINITVYSDSAYSIHIFHEELLNVFAKEYSDSLAVELVFSSLWSHVVNSCSCDVIFCKSNNSCKTVRLH